MLNCDPPEPLVNRSGDKECMQLLAKRESFEMTKKILITVEDRWRNGR